MGFNRQAVEICPSCGNYMKKGHYLCTKCSYIPVMPMPPLRPEFVEYERTGSCKKCPMKWLCEIWVFNLGLLALCEIPDENDLILLRSNGQGTKT